ncbi:RapZ C-terminal domain-containing protein [Sphaerisporangium aureirubrum]|uniref:ATPase n=1 Tax=Sphaerisporangium aureirubrum TaxID=1544736 RepID=A0ABW1NF59_9ACTN
MSSLITFIQTLTTTWTGSPSMPSAAVEIVSFGYLHGEPPPAHLIVDLRHHFKDPHVSPELRCMTAHDEPVRATVLGTPGITHLVQATASAVLAFLAGPNAGTVTVADGCAGGRHRAPTFAMALADLLMRMGVAVDLHHRDLSKPVVQR